jgi:TolA-binding protein
MSEHGETSETRSALAEALEATRRSFDGTSERAHDTERRILESTRKTTRTPRVFWLVPLAAAFVVSAAFADEIGGRLSDLTSGWFADGDDVESAPSSSGSASSPKALAPSPQAPPAPVPSASAAPEVVEPAPTPAPTSAAPPGVTTIVPAVRPVPSSSATAPEAASELAIYKEAHRAHFADHDYARALAAWDRYLLAAPRGTFALEARYNRAIALHRLGRRAEAVEALRPFADGAYGRYRRDEAQRLIEELR